MKIKHLIAMTATGIALEDVSNGKLFAEHEHEIYVGVGPAMLEALKAVGSADRQLQWQVKLPKTKKNAADGSMRVRRIQKAVKSSDGGAMLTPQNGNDEYVFTIKGILGPGSRLEVPTPATKDLFDLFEYLAEQGMYKDRYHFPVPNSELVFEVDMFIMPDGNYAPVAKIDLEVTSKELPIPELPFEVEWKIMGDTTDAAERKKISSFYDDYFLIPNPHLGEKKVEEEATKPEAQPTDLSEKADDKPKRDDGDHEYR